MNAQDIVELLARMTTPQDEFDRGETNGHEFYEEFEEDLSSDRMEDDARALWRLIGEARAAMEGVK